MVLDISRFQQLVEDLLEISRFDAGVVRLELEEVHLAELVMQAVSHSSESDVPVELDAELAGVVVHADKRRIVRVIANLLDNAAKYAGGASAVILRQVEDGIQIAVEDHRSEEHTSELQSLMRISYAVFCLKQKRTPR